MSSIKLCTKKDIKDLKEFLDDKWQKNHILVKDDSILDFQHKNKNIYHFVISRNNSNCINGILGFIPTYQFDQKLSKDICVWLAIWKVDEEISPPGLGVVLIKWLEEYLNPKFIGTVGQNTDANELYKILGYHLGEMNHYYFPDEDLEEYKISKNINKNIIPKILDNALDIKKIDFEEIDNDIFINVPKKTKFYIENRFLNHPRYNYLFFGIYLNKKLKVLLIARIVSTNNSFCLRIVDMFGDYKALGDYQFNLKKLIKKYNCEYVDCLNYGISKKLFHNWGFILKKNKVIIPEYFEPFIQDNRIINFAFKPYVKNYTIFKSDCDQDRPNLVINNLYDKE